MRHRKHVYFGLVVTMVLLLLGPSAPGVQASAPRPIETGIALPAESAPSQATVTVPALNVRAGPGTGFAIVGRATAGTVLVVKGQNAAGDWLQVQTPEAIQGWVSATFARRGGVVTAAPAAAPAPAGSPIRIVAPTIGLDTRVVPSGWHEVRAANGIITSEWDVPTNAAGWLVSSALPGVTGNTVLAGHHNILGEVFRYVVNLNVGDPITLYTSDRVLHYQVAEKFILADKYVSDAQRRENGRWIGHFDDERLTLVTCWPYTNNTHRVVVVARPVAS